MSWLPAFRKAKAPACSQHDDRQSPGLALSTADRSAVSRSNRRGSDVPATSSIHRGDSTSHCDAGGGSWPVAGTTTDDPDSRLLRYCGRPGPGLPQPCGLWMHGALPIEIVESSPTMTSLGGSISSRARSSDLPHQPERSLHQILHPPAFVHRRTRKQPVLERVAVAAGRARSGGAAVHAAAVFAAHGGRHAGMAGAGRRAAATARQHRAGVTRASHLCARAAPGPARVPAGSAASSARRRAV
jgi:hypothetical protein